MTGQKGRGSTWMAPPSPRGCRSPVVSQARAAGSYSTGQGSGAHERDLWQDRIVLLG